eukprot:2699705-Pyramimonas_sp.AAC.1
MLSNCCATYLVQSMCRTDYAVQSTWCKMGATCVAQAMWCNLCGAICVVQSMPSYSRCGAKQ